MSILLAAILGVFMGWCASVLLKTNSAGEILIDIGTGFLGALPMASLMGNNSIFDSLLAGGLGALMALAILQAIRARLKND